MSELDDCSLCDKSAAIYTVGLSSDACHAAACTSSRVCLYWSGSSTCFCFLLLEAAATGQLMPVLLLFPIFLDFFFKF